MGLNSEGVRIKKSIRMRQKCDEMNWQSARLRVDIFELIDGG